MAVLIALTLAMFAGFAAQRGSICGVAAVNDLVTRRSFRRYGAFFESAAWSLSVLSLAGVFGMTPITAPANFAIGVSAAAGGALFGVGAAINGACTFGSAARLGRGELAYAAMPVGFLLGVASVSQIVSPAASSSASVPTPTILVTALVFFVGFQIFRLSDRLKSPRDAVRKLAAPDWHPSFAMAMIGISSALLLIFFAPWPYSSLLVDLGAKGMSADAPLKVALAVFFVVGAGLGAHTRQALKIAKPSLRAIAEKAAGGALMGAGAFLIPGGNDSLVLVGLPHLFGYAFVAYLAMTAAIAAVLSAGDRIGKSSATDSS